MNTIPTRRLPSGDRMPMLGVGTAKLRGERVRQTVRTALDAGYTHVDTAEGYENETEIGEVLADYDRGDLFVTSKVLPTNLHYETVLRSCRESLDRLETSYLDLYLVHWPNPAISLRQTLLAMERLHDQGLVRNVGVSNFDRYHLRFATRITDVPLSVNQIEFHPLWNQEEVHSYCEEHDVSVTAAAPLGQTRVLEDDVIEELARTYGKDPAQITLRWHYQKGIATIPRSTSPEHVAANARVFDWELDPADVARIDAIERSEKMYDIDLDDHLYGTPH